MESIFVIWREIGKTREMGRGESKRKEENEEKGGEESENGNRPLPALSSPKIPRTETNN